MDRLLCRHAARRLRLGPARLSARTAFALAALLLLAAALIGWAVATGWSDPADHAVLLAIGGALAGHAAIARDVTHLGDPPVRIAVTVAAVVALLVARRPRDAVFVALTVASGAAVVDLLKALVDRARPALLPHLDAVHNASFPSGHAANSALVYGAIALATAETRAGRPLTVAAVLIALLVGLSRIGLAVHWPSDVLAGWAIGAGWLFLARGLREQAGWRSR